MESPTASYAQDLAAQIDRLDRAASRLQAALRVRHR
jgi:hypothetical protein